MENIKLNERWGLRPVKKTIVVMKLSCIFLIFSLLQVSAKGFTQNVFITLHADNISLEQLFAEIEKQAEVKFLYRYENVAGKQVNINADNIALAAVLNEALHLTNMKYTVMENDLIVVAPENVALQGITVTGVVSDNEGQPLPGVNVTVKGTTTGISTDIDGKFALQVPDNQAVLLFSYVGFMPQEITVGSQRSINITLLENMRSLDEVVVIGYGTRTKKDLTGAISQISSEEITRQVTLSPEFAMQGKMAGVFVSNTGSNPAARPDIRIRGVTTLGTNDPLYVVDGVPLTEGGSNAEADARTKDLRGTVNVFTLINPNDIESISVLKDASATAIYGVRASNGVILITTKRGSEGKPRVNLTANYGIQNIFKRYDFVSQQEYVDLTLESINNNPLYNLEYWYPLYDPKSPEYMGNKPNYTKDWMDAALNKNAGIQDYNISVSGGNKMSNYAFGAGFTNQDDAQSGRSFDRYSVFMNSDHKLTKWLKIGESFRYIYSTFDQSEAGASYSAASFVLPWQPLYDSSQEDGLASPGRIFQGHGEANPQLHGYGYGPPTIGNFLGLRKHTKNIRELKRTMGSFYAEVSPFKGFRVKGSFSFDNYTNLREIYREDISGIFEIRAEPYDFGNRYTRHMNENINTVYELLVGYSEKFGDHSVDLVLNYMAQKVQWNVSWSNIEQNSPITSWDQRYIDEGWPLEDKQTHYQPFHSALIGYMGRLSYNFAQKYYLDATVRRDGTSKFGPGYKWGIFPSFAGAWRISSESFMQNLPWLNDLKIRGGWGQTGNQETLDFAYLSMINLNPKAAFGNGGSASGDGVLYPAAAIGSLSVKDMSWETVTTYSLGFDLIALRNRLSFTAEYYVRNTDGILQTLTIPLTLGATGSPRVNLAKVNNRGFEFQVGYNDRFGDIGVHATANLTTVRNEVRDLYRGLRQGGANNMRIENGFSMNYLYGYKTDGLFRTQQEVDNWKWKEEPNSEGVMQWVSGTNDVGNMSAKGAGDVRFVDINGAPEAGSGALYSAGQDHLINSYDQVFLGKTIPGYYYGFSLGADYKNWDITLDFRGVGDVQKTYSRGYNSLGISGNLVTGYRDRFTSTNTSTNVPRAMQGDPSGNNRMSDIYIFNAGFLRFQNCQIGYNFRGELISKVGISNLRCYISGSNLFVISPYPDLDPEDITTPTTFTLGVNLSF